MHARNGGARVDTSRDYVRTSVLGRWWRAIRRAVLLRWYRWHLRCLTDERAGYEAAGLPLGRAYIAEHDRQCRVLRGRISFLEAGL